MGWNGRPASGARRDSMPSRLPIQWMSAPSRPSAAATARPALVCPPVPPPAMTTRTASALLEGEVDQPRDELGVGNAGGFPELGIGARRGEAGQRVDLVDEHAALALDEEVHAREPGAVHGPEGLHREPAHAAGDLGSQRGGHLEGGVTLAVLRLVVVPLARVADLAGDGGLWMVVTQHGNLDLAPLDAALDENAAVVAGSQGDGRGEVLGRLDFADAHARSEVRGFHEAGEAEGLAHRALYVRGLAPPLVTLHEHVVHDGQPMRAEHVLHGRLVHAHR